MLPTPHDITLSLVITLPAPTLETEFSLFPSDPPCYPSAQTQTLQKTLLTTCVRQHSSVSAKHLSSLHHIKKSDAVTLEPYAWCSWLFRL